MDTVKKLSLVRQRLTKVPDDIFELKHLEHMNLSNNQLTTIPDAIGELQNLISLDLSNNRLTTIPDTIGKLPNLISLDLSDNQLTTIPDTIGQLYKKLHELHLSNNRLSNIPLSVFKLTNLITLDLSHNQLSSVPNAISHLQNLIRLRLEGNWIVSLNEGVYDLGFLRLLTLNDNQIGEILPDILRLRSLKELTLDENPIKTPPIEVVAGLRDSSSYPTVWKVKNYFIQIEKEGKDFIYEAKLIIIGEAGAGKTTLAKKLEDLSYKLRDEETTEGIDVTQWEWELPIGENKRFRVNTWDFGGQEIYHATHQFFLTKRSLYALVADTRKEDTDFYYWLNVVELLSDSSPLLIIKNEKQDRHREINVRQLRERFTNLKETLAVNLATNRGLPKVVDEIKHRISKLSHIGSELPKTWVRVREALENDSRSYISFDEYLLICEDYGFEELKDKLQLSGYLHDLGVCLHFQNDPLLKKTVILKPEWGTAAVYKVLDNPIVIRKLGKFTRAELEKIWFEDNYVNMHDELLQLMINFQLCYKVPVSNDTYVAPQLLTENQPLYTWPEQSNLILRYSYDFMPKGIITRFIVIMNKLIHKQKFVWKSGVILLQKDKGLIDEEKIDHTWAEVIQDYDKRELKIRIAGIFKRELLTIVTYELDKIHKSYRRLKYSKLIPCNCSTCKDSQTPYFYPYEILHKFMRDLQEFIQCQKSYEMVDVRSLIDNITEEPSIINLSRGIKKGKKQTTRASKSKRDNVIHIHESDVTIDNSPDATIDNSLTEVQNMSKTIKFGNGANVSGNVIVADRIMESFNVVDSSDVSGDLKTLLKNLATSVSEVCEKLPEEEVEQLTDALETLTKEATRKKPRKEWWELSVKGIKEAAQSVGEIGKTTIMLLKELMPFLEDFS